jgi:hypothetical protein
MTQRFDLISPRARKDGKTFWCRVGAAFPRDKGGYSLVFDALPLPDAEGRVSLLMVEPTQRDGQRQQSAPQGGGPAPYDDDIAFGQEWRL